MRNRMKSNNRILVRIEKVYDNEKVVKDSEGKEVTLLTDAQDGNDLMLGDRHMKEWTKANIATVAVPIGGFSGVAKCLQRSMDGKVYTTKVYEDSDIAELKVGDTVLIQHNVSEVENQIELPNGEIVYNAAPPQIHCKVEGDKITPLGGYVLLDKISDEEELEKISDVILIDDNILQRNKWDKYYKAWGRMKAQRKPLKGDYYLKAQQQDLVWFNKRFAQTIIFNEVEYWLIMPSDAYLIVSAENFDKIKMK